MKTLISYTFILSLLILSASELKAQNQKTNAGKVNNPPRVTPSPPNPAQSTPGQSSTNNNLNTAEKSTDDLPKDTSKTSASGPFTSKYGNKGLLSIGFLVGTSQGKFKEVSNDDWGYGLGITGMYNFMGNDNTEKQIVNVHAGLSFEYMSFGGKSSTDSYDDYDYPNLVTNKITTSVNSNVYSLIIVSRTEFFTGPFIPFVELAAGGRVFTGNEKVEFSQTLKPGTSFTFTPKSLNESKSLESSLTASYGLGGGLRIGTNAFRAEIKMMYMYGTTAKYIDKETVKFDQTTNTISYKTKSSTTDMFIPQIGISTNF